MNRTLVLPAIGAMLGVGGMTFAVYSKLSRWSMAEID
jgi:hypothetical protein